MSQAEILAGIAAMQRVQMSNPPSSTQWQRADQNLRKLVGLLNGVKITREMWDRGVTK